MNGVTIIHSEIFYSEIILPVSRVSIIQSEIFYSEIILPVKWLLCEILFNQ